MFWKNKVTYNKLLKHKKIPVIHGVQIDSGTKTGRKEEGKKRNKKRKKR